MPSPFHSQRDAAGVLGTYRGAERLLLEQALDDDRLERRSWRPRLWPRKARARQNAPALLAGQRRAAAT